MRRLIYIIGAIAKNFFLTIFYSSISIFIRRSKKIWAVGGWSGKRFADNSKYIFLYINHYDEDLDVVWITKDNEINEELNGLGYKSYLSRSLKGVYYSLKASVHIVDQNQNDINPWAASSALTVNLWHGIGLKKVGQYCRRHEDLSTIQKIFRYLITPKQWIHGNYYLLATSEHTKRILMKSFETPEEKIILAGYPRIDKVYNQSEYSSYSNTNLDSLKRNLKKIKSNKNRIIGYFPTFRDTRDNSFLGTKSEKEQETVDQFLKQNNMYLITKEHAIVSQNSNDDKNFTNIMNIDSNIDLYEILNEIDCLISDYSTIFLDYLVLDKPIIIYSYDLEYYRDSDRGLMDDYFSSSDVGPRVNNINMLLSELRGAFSGKDKYTEKRKKVKTLFFDCFDGKNGERIVSSIKDILGFTR